MAAEGMVNVGQLVREKYGQEHVYAVGFGTYQGSVIAADRWGGELPNQEVLFLHSSTFKYSILVY